MEYLLAGNLLQNPGKAMPSIFNFTSKIVDKLWLGKTSELSLYMER